MKMTISASSNLNNVDEKIPKASLPTCRDTGCVSQPDWPAVIVINHYHASQITADQSGCDTQPDVPTLTCAPGAHIVPENTPYRSIAFALIPDSGSAVPLLLHNADELYDSSTSCWNPAIRNESNACIELFTSCRSLCKG
ncbi:hypothetical protein Tco_0744820 [Tanacetum coccineum]